MDKCPHCGKRILDIAAVSRIMDVSRQWIDTLRARGETPDAEIMLGQSPGWTPATIDKWLAGRRRRQKAEAKS